MKKLINNLKDPITDIIGITIMLFTVYNVLWTHKIMWIWEGLAGLGAGTILFMMPDDFLLKLIERITDKFLK